MVKKNVLAATVKVGEQAGKPETSIEQAEKKVEGLKGRESAIRELGELCKEKECVEYEHDDLQAKWSAAKTKAILVVELGR